MAKDTTLSNVAAQAAANAIADLFDGGDGTIKIYTTAKPANPDVAVSGQTLLATLTMATPGYGAAADGDPGGVVTAGAIASDTSADATGTAVWFRKATSGGTAHVDGTVGTSDADLIVNTVAFVAGATVAISSDTMTMPETP